MTESIKNLKKRLDEEPELEKELKRTRIYHDCGALTAKINYITEHQRIVQGGFECKDCGCWVVID